MQAKEAGGKAANLKTLQDAGYQVPKFMVIAQLDFEHSTDNILEKIKSEFSAGTLYAVRSSASVEDSSEYSYAGQFSTYLNVAFDDLREKINAVFASADSEHLRRYVKSQNHIAALKMSVIVQEMIQPELSGVAFGANPATQNEDEKIIAVVEGLAEKLVNGTVDGEQYLLRKNEIAERGNLLNEAQILTISKTLDELKTLFDGNAQDIEFAFANDQFYLLQSRPITTLAKNKTEEIVWDNSNIVESYPDLTLPLTFSFIEKMYEAVYRQFSLVLGISRDKVEANSDTFSNMLGLLNGRVYYNMNSWFRSLALLPGYSLNADFMQKMMGVKEKIEFEFTVATKKSFTEYVSVANAIIGLMRSLKNARKGAKTFIHEFENVYQKFDQKNFASYGINEIISDYQQFEKLMVERWKAPLVNDLFAMIYFGSLQKMTTGMEGDLHNKLIGGSDDIITTEPMKWLPKLARSIAKNEKLKTLFLSNTPEDVWKEINSGKYPDELEQVVAYINKWGDRTLAELKLETVTYRQSPEMLIGILTNYIRRGIFDYSESKSIRTERITAEEIILDSLKGKWVKRTAFKHVLKQARYFVSNRENLRYYRTKAFGMVRRMMLAIGEKLQADNLLDSSSDIFYLKLEEITGLNNCEILKHDFKNLVSERKKQYQFFAQQPLPQRIKTRGKRSVILHPSFTEKEVLPTDYLKGTPCSSGVVSATVRLVKNLQSIDSLDQNILATYSTDPGWVVLFPSCSGILTERGSMLSHAAIVSREMGIPCIVGIEGLMQQLKDGDEILMDGTSGIIQILSSKNS